MKQAKLQTGYTVKVNKIYTVEEIWDMLSSECCSEITNPDYILKEKCVTDCYNKQSVVDIYFDILEVNEEEPEESKVRINKIDKNYSFEIY